MQGECGTECKASGVAQLCPSAPGREWTGAEQREACRDALSTFHNITHTGRRAAGTAAVAQPLLRWAGAAAAAGRTARHM